MNPRYTLAARQAQLIRAMQHEMHAEDTTPPAVGPMSGFDAFLAARYAPDPSRAATPTHTAVIGTVPPKTPVSPTQLFRTAPGRLHVLPVPGRLLVPTTPSPFEILGGSR